jgi:hypothetical protein
MVKFACRDRALSILWRECPAVHLYPSVKVWLQLFRWLFVPCDLAFLAKTSNKTKQAPFPEERERPRSVIDNNRQISVCHRDRFKWRWRTDKIFFTARHCISFGRSQFPFKGCNGSYYIAFKMSAALVRFPQIADRRHACHSQISIICESKRR